MPSASATVSLAWMARQARPLRLRRRVDADEQAAYGEGEQNEVPDAAVVQDDTGDPRFLHRDARREAALGLVFAAEIDDDEVQRQGADREIEPAQPQ